MKILLLYYSRTERTAKLMEELSSALAPERVIRIETEKPRQGAGGAFRSAAEAIRGATPDILPVDPPPVMSDYDLVIIGAPVWAGRPASPVMSFLNRYPGVTRAAYLLTSSGGGPQTKAMDALDVGCGLKRAFELSLGKPSGNDAHELELLVSKVKALENEP